MLTEDQICVTLLFCATFGVGSMSFGSIFAAAGPLLASLAIYFLSACNLHASIAVSKALTVVPISVRSFSDLGYFAFGDVGRRVILASEAGVCYLTPIAFLILGGTSLLPVIFQDVFGDTNSTQWILVMALAVVPIMLLPTLKSVAPLCIIGGVVAVLSDLIAIGFSLSELPFSPRETELSVENVVPTFGTIMFAMGTAIMIPPIQRQHSDPNRLANLVTLTLLYITSIYMLIGIVTYYQFGCTAPQTLLAQLPAGPWKKLAASLMLVHVLVAFPVMLTPTLFDLERWILGKDGDVEVLQQTIAIRAAKLHLAAGKPILSSAPTIASLDDDGFLYGSRHTNTSTSSSSSSSSVGGVYFQAHSPTRTSPTSTSFGDESYSASSSAALDATTFTLRDRLVSGLIRTLTIGSQAFLAVMLQNCFADILSLIGATAVTMSCMIMPCLCYLKVYPIPTHLLLGRCDRVLCYVIIITSALLGVYCTVIAAGNIHRHMAQYALFTPVNGTLTATNGGGDDDEVKLDQYPYCHVGERN